MYLALREYQIFKIMLRARYLLAVTIEMLRSKVKILRRPAEEGSLSSSRINDLLHVELGVGWRYIW